MAGSTEYKNKWQAENKERINLVVSKGQKAIIQAHAESQKESVNGFINRAIQETMERDTGDTGSPQEGGILSTDTLNAAQKAAEATGEAVSVFIARAVERQAQRDKSSLSMGINPATGERSKKQESGE